VAFDEKEIQLLNELFDRRTEAIVARVVAAIRATPTEAPMPRLTVEEFATAVQLHVVTVRRKIRVGDIPRNLVFGENPKKISPRALELFGVTPLEARVRLAARSPSPASLPSAA
jgi:hypothetical protein